MARKKLVSPAQAARRKLLETHKLRGNANANIWLTSCPLTQQDVVLTGDLRIEHFYACEGDPSAVRTVYIVDPVEVTVDARRRQVKFDAVVDFLDGRAECHLVSASSPVQGDPKAALDYAAALEAAKSLGRTYRAVRPEDLNRHQQRIQNWRRALRFLRACSHHVLEPIELDVMALLSATKQTSLGKVVHTLERIEAPLVLGAAVRLIRKRVLESDLDDAPWSRHTMVRLGGAQ